MAGDHADGVLRRLEKGTEMLGVVRGLESYSVMRFYEQLYRPDLVEEALKGDPQGKHKDAAYNLNLEKILDAGPRHGSSTWRRRPNAPATRSSSP